MDLGPAHRSLEAWHDSPARRRQHMACVWQSGAGGLVDLTVPGTALACYVFERGPLRPAEDWLQAELDSTGRAKFALTDPRALDPARHRGMTHVVVPRDLLLTAVDEDGDELKIVSWVAVLDVLENRIVWQGQIDGGRMLQDVPGHDSDLRPALTLYETASYAWLLDLCDVMDRIRVQPGEDEPGLNRLCQEAPLVFSLEQ